MPTLQALTFVKGNDRTSGPIWNYARGTLPPWKECPTFYTNYDYWLINPRIFEERIAEFFHSAEEDHVCNKVDLFDETKKAHEFNSFITYVGKTWQVEFQIFLLNLNIL